MQDWGHLRRARLNSAQVTERAEVTAVHEDEAYAFLERLGVAVSYRTGVSICSVCGQPLRDAGLGAVRAREGSVIFACGKLDCLDDFHRGDA